MAKKKSVAKWTHEDQVILLAWLDYSIRHKEDFHGTVINHLKKSLNKNFTISQIERKIKSFHRNEANIDNWRNVLNQGSSVLVLSDEMKRGVETSLTSLEDEHTSQLISTPRRLRSSSTLCERQSSERPTILTPKVDGNTEYANNKTRREQGSLEVLTRKALMSNAVRIISEDVSQSSRKKRRVMPNQSPTYLKNTYSVPELEPRVRSYSRSSQRSSLSVSSLMNDIVERYDTISNGSEDEYETGGGTTRKATYKRQERQQRSLSVPVSSGGFQGHCECGKENYTLEVLRQAWQRRLDAAISNTRQLQKELQQKDTKLLRCEEDLKNSQNQVSDAQMHLESSEEARLVETMRQNRYLNKQLKNKVALVTFTKLRPASCEWLGKITIQSGFLEIFAESKQVLYRHNSRRPFFIPSFSKNETLRLLCCKGFGLDPDAVRIPLEHVTLNLARLSPQAVVRALITSALREWVFQTDFPRLDEESSELLKSYREHLLTQDGPLTVRNLDLAACSSTINSDHLQKQVIPSKARNLAVRLSQALAPFFSRDPDNPLLSDWNGFATWGQGEKEQKELQLRLINIFEKALRIKADSLLNIEEYEMVIYSPGTPFDKGTMRVETMQGAPPPEDSHDGLFVEICVEPALFSFPKPELSEDCPISEALVQSRNFICREENRRRGAKLILEAVVVLRTEPKEEHKIHS